MNAEQEECRMKILVFGTGNEYQKYGKWLGNEDIVALLDNDIKKQGTVIGNIPVVSPQKAKFFSVDRIYIMSSLYVQEMTEQLVNVGIPEEKIYYLFDLFELGIEYKVPDFVLPAEGKSKKKIALLSDNLQLSGAQFALLNMAISLKKNGYFSMIASPESGKLRNYIRLADIPLMIDERLRIGKMRDIEWLEEFDLIIVNTVLNYHLLLDRNINKPTIWWLHETEYFYRLIVFEKVKKIDSRNLYIYAVSNLARQPLLEIRKDFHVGDLFVYVKEDVGRYEKAIKDKKKVIIAVIGVVCELKGQDILLNALDLLKEEENGKIEIWMIGREDTDFIKKYGNIIERHRNVRKFGELGKEDLKKLYKEIDVIACVSRSENLCMAVLEGAEHNIVPIVSTAAAIADYFVDGSDGIIFQSEDVKELAEKIRWCIENTDRLPDMGKRAHDVYEKRFSEEVFERDLLRAIRKAWDLCTIKKNTYSQNL